MTDLQYPPGFTGNAKLNACIKKGFELTQFMMQMQRTGGGATSSMKLKYETLKVEWRRYPRGIRDAAWEHLSEYYRERERDSIAQTGQVGTIRDPIILAPNGTGVTGAVTRPD